MKGYNRRLAIDPFAKKEVSKDNSLRNLAVFILVVAVVLIILF